MDLVGRLALEQGQSAAVWSADREDPAHVPDLHAPDFGQVESMGERLMGGMAGPGLVGSRATF